MSKKKQNRQNQVTTYCTGHEQKWPIQDKLIQELAIKSHTNSRIETVSTLTTSKIQIINQFGLYTCCQAQILN